MASIRPVAASCQVCHGTSTPPTELQAATGPLNTEKGSLGGYGNVFGPLFADPNPLRAKTIPKDQNDFLKAYESREAEMIGFLKDNHLVTLPR